MDLNLLKKELFGGDSTGSSSPVSDEKPDWDTLIDSYSSQYPSVPKNIVKAIIQQESGGNHKAVGPMTKYGTAKGAGQFIDSTAKQYIPGWQSPEDSFNPDKSVAGIFNYMDTLIRENKGDIKKAVGRYFGTGVDPVLNKSTDEYSSEVMQKAGMQQGQTQRLQDPNTDFIKRTLFGDGQQQSPQQQPAMQPITGMQQAADQPAIPEQQKKPGVLQDVGNALTAGAGTVTSGFYSIPAGLTSVFLGANNLLNKGINAVTGKKLFKEDYQTPKMLTENKLVQVPKQVAEEARSKISTKDQDLVELVKKGDVGGAARFLGNWVFEQVPQQAMNMGIILAGVPNVEALTLMGLTTGGSKEVENKEKVRSGEITQEQSALSVLGNAAFEVGTEAFGDVPVADALKKAFAKKASEVGVEAAKETLGKTFQRVLKGYFGAIKQEVPSEVVATIGQALTDKYSGVRPDLTPEQLFSEVVTTAAGTSLMGQAGALGGLQESNTIRAGQKQQTAEQAQLQPIQQKLNADPDFQRAMNAPDLTGTMQPIVDMQGYRDRMKAEQMQGDESIAGKIASEQQQPEVETPEGLKPEPEMKPIVQQPEEDTGPQQVDATEEQINVGKTLAVNNGKVVFQKSSWGMKATNPNTGEKVDIKPKFEFKDKETNGNITMSLDEISSPDAENILETKILEQRKAFEEGEKFRKEKGLTPTSELDAQDKASKLKKEKLNAEAIKKEDSNEKSVRVDEGVSKRKGETNKGERVEVSDISTGIDDVPSVQPVTEKQEESTVSPAIERPPEQKAEIEAINTNPTKPQKEAGNYRKAHIKRDGMDISIENAAGQERKGTDKAGKEWKVTMNHDYGYIRGTKGADAYRDRSTDQLDVFINPGSPEGGDVFVVNQKDPATGKFDEHKALIGFANKIEASKAYKSNYEKGWKGLKSVVRMPMEQFKKWAYSEDTKNELTQEIADKYKTEQTGAPEKVEIESTNNIKEKTDEKEVSQKTETVLNEKVETPSLENEVLNRIKITDRHRNDVKKYSKAEFAKLYSNEVKSEVAKAFIDSTPEIGYDKTFDNAVSYEGTIGIAKNLYDKIKAEKDTDKVGSPSSDQNTQLVNDYVQLIKTHHGNKERIPNTRRILDIADKAHGGTIAEGKYGIRDAYDALETAMNKYVEEIGLDEDPKETIKKLNNAIKVLPTQTVRTEDQVEKQQFSTPPSEAYLAVMASGIKEGMTGLEPSAGDGNIATIMRLANKGKGEIYTNEIDERRRNNLKILGFNPTDADAEYLHSTLPKEIQPDVVVMNPPFSATGGRLKSHNTGFGAEHVRQALLRLKDGGRLVAIVGNGMALGKPKMASWWSKIQKEYNVRANIGISGKEYEKYGTGFDNNIIVIDKIGPTENIETAITGEGLTVEQGYDKLEPLMKEDVYGRIKGNVSKSGKKLDEEKPEGSVRSETTDNTGDSAPGGSGRGAVTDKGSGAKSKSVEGMGESVSSVSGTAGKSDTGNNESGKTGGSDTENGQRTDEKLLPESGNNDTGSIGSEQERVRLKKSKSSGIEEESGGVYAKYKVKKALYEGAVPHPANISESVTMASVELPDVTYKLSLPKKLITGGALSDAQLEAITYACQAHEQTLPNGMRKEYLIGDGTGMGKARTLLGIIYENSLKGRKKFVYITKSKGLINQLKGDMEAMGIGLPVIPLEKFKKGEQIDATEGILFGTYSTVSGDFSSKKDRYNQVLNWFGKDNDSVFVFDESHLMKNVSESWTPWGSEDENIKQLGEGSQRGQMGVQFKKDLPNARFVNASATAATEPVNLAYLTRLGLWGDGTPFKDFVAFLNTMRDGGVGAMELLARDMKANGLYLARSISYDGVNYETLNHTLSQDEKMVYNDMADFWSEILVKMEEAAANANMKKESQRIMKQFYAAQQRFFLQLMMLFQVETMIKDADKKLGEGKSVVISLFNTNEQQTDKKVSEAIDNGIDIDSIDFSPKDSMKHMIENNFPIYQYEEYTDEDGTKRTRQVLDKNGEPLINKENLDAMRKLVDKIENFRTPENPIDRIVNHFGFEKVAEITGRKKRIVVVNGRKEYRDRSIKGVAQKNINAHEIKQFMDGDKRVAIISGAAATGFDLHASLKQKNKQRRVFYALQLSWSADEQMQSFGRVHRTMQASAPEIVLVKTDVASQQRLINTIQSRLASLGAISKGERESLSGGIFSIEDITDSYGKSALGSTIKEMSTPDLARMNAFDKEGNIKSSVSQDVSGFLNRIMVLPIDKQNAAFDKFYSKYKDNVEYAKQKGTFDTGVEKISGENIRLVGEPVILNEDKASGVKTEIITIEYEKKTHKETIRERRDNTSNLFEAKNKKSQRGYLYRVWDDGKVTVYGPRGAHGTIDKSEFLEKYEKTTKEEVESSWSEEYKNIPEYDTIQTHLVTGSIFPVYNKIFYDQKQGRKIKRAVLADGRSFIGVEVKKAFIPKIKQNFGIGSDLYSAGSQEIIDLVNAGSIIEFDNGWKVSQRRVMGEDRIELDPGRTYVTAQQMEGMGLFNEIIASSKRYFIPTDTEKSIATMDNILKRAKPIRDLAAAQKTAMASAPLFERDVTKENQIYTTEFKEWFGDWENDPENASKVVDENGKPEIFYHGSDRKLEKIEPGYDEPGAWFTVLKTAQNYAKGTDGRVHEAYLSVKKPMVVDFNSDMEPIVDGEVINFDNNVDIVKYAQKRGYDGVHFKRGNFTEDAETWVVFNSKQIKIKKDNADTPKQEPTKDIEQTAETKDNSTVQDTKTKPIPEEPLKVPNYKVTGIADAGTYADIGESVLPGTKQAVKQQEKEVVKDNAEVSRSMQMPEIVEMVKAINGGKVPRIRERIGRDPALNGIFKTGSQEIQLRADLFKDPIMAAKVLAHEIGHLSDYLPDKTMSRGNILGRIATLKRYTSILLNGKPQKKQIMDELKALSMKWKPFDPAKDKKYTAYRHSSKELYADAFSVLINNPGMLKKEAPTFYENFMRFIDKKPELNKIYTEIQTRLFDPAAVGKHRLEGLYSMVDQTDNLRQEARDRAKKDTLSIGDFVYKYLIDRDYALLKKIKTGKKGSGEVAIKAAKAKDEIEQTKYIATKVQVFVEDIADNVLKPLNDNNLTHSDLGVYMFLNRASTERATIANPRGFGEAESISTMEELEKSLGKEKFEKLKEIDKAYRELRKNIIVEAEKAGLYTPDLVKTMKERVDSYAKFSVASYMEEKFGGEASSKVFHQIGTLADIANPFVETVLQDMSVIRAAKINTMKSTVLDFLSEMGESQEADMIFSQDINGRIAKPPKDPNKKLVHRLKDGKLESFYISKEIADSFERNPVEASAVADIISTITSPVKQILVAKNPIWMARNVVRDFQATVKNNPEVRLRDIPKLAKYYKDAYTEVIGAVFKGNRSADLREMRENFMLNPDRVYSGKDVYYDNEIERIATEWQVDPRQAERYDSIKGRLKQAWDVLNKMGKVSELGGKLAGFKYLKNETDLSMSEIGHRVRTRIGTPDARRQGVAHQITNNIWMFSNISKEGTRSMIESFNEDRGAYIWKSIVLNVLPKLVLYGGAVTLAATGDDWLKNLLDKIPEYDKQSYSIIPIGINKVGKAVYIRLPQDYEGQNWGAIAWALANGRVIGDGGALDKASGFIPYTPSSLNPYIKVGSDLFTYYVRGQNPVDDFRGRDVIPPKAFAAGGLEANKYMVQDIWGKLGGNTIYSPYDYSDRKDDVVEKVLRYPGLNVLGSFLRYSDRGESEAYYRNKNDEIKEKAKLSLKAEGMIAKRIKSSKTIPTTDDILQSFRELKAEKLVADDKSYAEFRNQFFRVAAKTVRDNDIKFLLRLSKKERRATLPEMQKKLSPADYINLVDDLNGMGALQ